MKIKIEKNKGNNLFYDEFLYIQEYCKRFIKNPKRTSKLLTKEYKRLLIVGVIIFMFALLLHKGIVVYLCIGSLGVCIVVNIALLINANAKMKFFLEHNEDCELLLNEDYVELANSVQSCKIKWSDIKHIVVNQYTICFIPNKVPGYVLAISNEYKEDLFKVLKKLKKEDLFFDNSELY